MLNLKGKSAEKWLKLIRLYTFYSPIRKGKYRLFQMALKQVSELPDEIISESVDHRSFVAYLRAGMFDTLFFIGEYERDVTNVIEKVVKKDDICLDIGANFGWYTTLLAKLGVKEVHAFEPVSFIYDQLQRNIELQREIFGETCKVVTNKFALGDKSGTTELHIFNDLPIGHASMSTQGSASYNSHTAEIVTLDSYLDEQKINVNFIKMDIEGAELLCLQGATKLFEQEVPPIFVIEMALGTTKHFGYLPNDLIEFLRSHANYDFYAINEKTLKLRAIDGFGRTDIGANVLCVPTGKHETRLIGLDFE